MRKALRVGVVALAAVTVPVLATPSAHAIEWDHTLHTDDGDLLQYHDYGTWKA
jgi:hypothetical protein